jgi:hypothetical protein
MLDFGRQDDLAGPAGELLLMELADPRLRPAWRAARGSQRWRSRRRSRPRSHRQTSRCRGTWRAARPGSVRSRPRFAGPAGELWPGHPASTVAELHHSSVSRRNRQRRRETHPCGDRSPARQHRVPKVLNEHRLPISSTAHAAEAASRSLGALANTPSDFGPWSRRRVGATTGYPVGSERKVRHEFTLAGVAAAAAVSTAAHEAAPGWDRARSS